jgi:hypothetical protein
MLDGTVSVGDRKMMDLIFSNNEKFAMVALHGCHIDIASECTLPDGTVVLLKLPANLDATWDRWLGELRSKHILESNLIFLRKLGTSKPLIRDDESERLRLEINAFYALLPIYAAFEYAGAEILVGGTENSEVRIQGLAEMRDYYVTRGTATSALNSDHLVSVSRARLKLENLHNQAEQYRRLKAGLKILLDGLENNIGMERLHQFVRALEAVILPKQGETRKQFINRCQTFTSRNQPNADILGEAYDMRSDAEHIHEWDKSLSNHPRDQRDSIALHRTRQVETLVKSIYARILLDETLCRHFQTDEALAEFWKRPEPERKAIWGAQILDLTSII